MTFNQSSLLTIQSLHDQCDLLADSDTDLANVTRRFGYPPLWSRSNSFENLVWIILEQQVSLASAKAALEQLRKFVGTIEPQTIINLDDAELKACYVSRQKAGYIRGLARALLDDDLNLSALEDLSDDEVRRRLTCLKGLGNWTADIYLIFILHRPDIFPSGDLAARQALGHLKGLPQTPAPEAAAKLAAIWQQYRTAATMLLWHFYLSSKPASAPRPRTSTS